MGTGVADGLAFLLAVRSFGRTHRLRQVRFETWE
jgi:hypothetical protein